MCDYANHKDVRLAIFTNGITWEFFLPREEGAWEQRKFYAIDIRQQELDSVISRFFDFLGRENINNGKALENAKQIHDSRKRETIISENLPKVWNDIIGEPDKSLICLLRDSVEKVCGFKPDDEIVIKFLKEINKKTNAPVKVAHQEKQNHKQQRYGTARLRQIQGIIELMYKGNTFPEACNELARQLGIEPSTVRDKCTRQLGINTDKLIELVEKREIDEFLSQKFPNYQK